MARFGPIQQSPLPQSSRTAPLNAAPVEPQTRYIGGGGPTQYNKFMADFPPSQGGPSKADYSGGINYTSSGNAGNAGKTGKSTIQGSTPMDFSTPISSGASVGAMVGGPVGAGIGAGVGAVFSITKALMTYNAMKKQEAENKRVEAANLDLLKDEKTERRKQTAWERYWAERKFKDQEALNKYSKVLNFMTGFRNQLDKKPQLGANLVNMWNARRG